MDQKTMLYVGAAAAAYYFLVHRKNQGLPVVQSDGGGLVPAAPQTLALAEAQQNSRRAGLTQAAKNKRSVAAVMATSGGRSLATGARRGVSVSALQRNTVKAVQNSTPTKPRNKRRGIGGTLKLVGKATVRPLRSGVNLAARNPALASAAATAFGGPGAGAATGAGLAAYNSRRR